MFSPLILKEKDIQRFWKYVKKADEKSCWEWIGCKYPSGYGQMSVRNSGRKKLYKAHRISFLINKNKDPEHFFVCHHCDNKSCVNPNHLFLGTALENNRDMKYKGKYLNQQKTHCKYGHPFDLINTIYEKGPRGLLRRCRICRIKQGRESYKRNYKRKTSRAPQTN